MWKKLSFLIETLAPSLRDAIIIYRKLKIQYIWIDALCIIQGLPGGKDWKLESSVMDQTYGNAAVTIAASAAHDTSEGILALPGEPKSGSCIVSWTATQWTVNERNANQLTFNQKENTMVQP
jgi:hypothetical protein